MQFTRKSILTGTVRQRDIPCTQDQAIAIHQGWLITRAIPDISEEDYDFLVSGTTPEEWKQELATAGG